MVSANPPEDVRSDCKQKITTIVAAFKAGTAKHVLAKRFGLAERSLKKLLREEGVKRRSWNDIQA